LKILFVRFSSLGDVVLTTGIMKKFSEIFNNAEIHILTSKEFGCIFENEEYIKKILTFDRKSGFSSYIKFIQDNINGYDYIIDLHGSLRSKFLKITTDANYFSYKKDSFKRRLFVKKKFFKNELNKTVVERYWEILIKPFNVEKLNADDLKPFLNIPVSNENYIVIHPQASKKTKIWDKMDNLAENLINKGLNAVYIGKTPQSAPEKVKNLTGKTNLKELINVISKSSMLVTTDSGPMHIAIALNKKTLIIAGSTTKELGFLYEFKNTKIIEVESLECRPCHVHGLNDCPKSHFKCMKDIDEKVVEKETIAMLNST
jgi:ADP-heptose:LPS heptosyltransferase